MCLQRLPPRCKPEQRPVISEMSHDQAVWWMRAKIRRMVLKRLRLITKDDDARMSWTSFYHRVTRKYGVVVEGWPLELVPFKNLSKSTSSLPILETLWLRWKVGQTFFREATLEEMHSLEAMGAFAKQKRARRSDFCVVRGQHRNPATRSKRVKRKTLKSPAVVPDNADN